MNITLKLYANLPKIFGFKEKTYRFSSPTSVDQFFTFLKQTNTTIDQYISKLLSLPEKQRKNFIHVASNSICDLKQNGKDQHHKSITISLFPPMSGG
ncbi:hypothetical protein NEF87_002230 [Candidatus Lokiarchaeum ossiferum]|uniref:MoaD/ThiS family protein n=1 Tax=Candidatus Lokiarchaeum ossiferum TaxID=2951803 RepID=A0ABY6HR10_9ARCH|nr:hypothetical protein NEF87_002230 [Candidatus Lokiarchaeum sp. B-35]